jgi:flagellar protein FliO/FliZ
MTLEDYLKFFFALLFVLCLMGGLAYVIKRFGLNGEKIMPASQRRLKVIETLPIDARRRAILLRRDDKEHLVILGPTGETVVESNIPAKPESSQ